jgi:hypothetical protein
LKHTVTWTRRPEGKLADLWNVAADQKLVSTAANEIDRLLRISPDEQGESRSADRRIIIVPPLAAMFRVFRQDRLVRVLIVWRIDNRLAE